ncbi:hypothetical protein IE53DRAFT_174003 [Violaceomyces palustris]|uniref:Uncharacterized protein n=1 Tax=Violaceomyces palustris TaxID=1673888 RepID=A0ACD0P5X3_9BASI|nr:hypothetical protein IE53DRAFT_174003 [Violaceomyces palustris]
MHDRITAPSHTHLTQQRNLNGWVASRIPIFERRGADQTRVRHGDPSSSPSPTLDSPLPLFPFFPFFIFFESFNFPLLLLLLSLILSLFATCPSLSSPLSPPQRKMGSTRRTKLSHEPRANSQSSLSFHSHLSPPPPPPPPSPPPPPPSPN